MQSISRPESSHTLLIGGVNGKNIFYVGDPTLDMGRRVHGLGRLAKYLKKLGPEVLLAEPNLRGVSPIQAEKIQRIREQILHPQ